MNSTQPCANNRDIITMLFALLSLTTNKEQPYIFAWELAARCGNFTRLFLVERCGCVVPVLIVLFFLHPSLIFLFCLLQWLSRSPHWSGFGHAAQQEDDPWIDVSV